MLNSKFARFNSVACLFAAIDARFPTELHLRVALISVSSRSSRHDPAHCQFLVELPDFCNQRQTHRPPPVADDTLHGFYKKLEYFHGNDDLADFVIVCGDKRWNVHRLVRALHSDVLCETCSNGFRESQEKMLDLSADHQPEIIEALIDYMYSFEYSVPCAHPVEMMEFNVHLAILADKYNIRGLHTKWPRTTSGRFHLERAHS
ncbi:hypothetical protein BST61_g3278 [Cercospora zeina]